MEKKVALQRWRELPENIPLLEHFTPIPADAKGSTFGACGIRISGNPQFIDAVLSRIKDVLAAEAGSTRLTLSRQSVKPVAIDKDGKVQQKTWGNADVDAETCYIQIRERTAKTRLKRVREMTDELPNLTEQKPIQNEINPTNEEQRTVAHVGEYDDCEVLCNWISSKRSLS